MRLSLHWSTVALLASMSVACSARGGTGGGGSSDTDAGTTGDDTPSAMDTAAPTPDTGKPPVDTGTAPEDVGNAPVDVGNAPVDVGNAPVDVGNVPADVGQPPVDAGQPPVDVGQPPVDVGQPPMDMGQAPRCGDGPCNGNETCSSCPQDCGACPATECADIRDCAACVALTRCGWCTWGGGTCQAGNSVGPTVASMCPTFGTWVRSTSMCPAPDAGTPDAGGVNIQRSCVGVAPGLGLPSDCGWHAAQTFTCVAGTGITVGCTDGDAGACSPRVGFCSGDPMIRACAEPGCTYARRLLPTVGTSTNPDDDYCGTCPLARYICPPSGQIIVYTRAYDSGNPYTCTLGRG